MKKLFEHDFIGEVLFIIIVFFNDRIRMLNPRGARLVCKCGGRLLYFKNSNKGRHYLCLKRFEVWIKPPMGAYYREKDLAKRRRKISKGF